MVNLIQGGQQTKPNFAIDLLSDDSSEEPEKLGHAERIASTPMFLIPKLGKNKETKKLELSRK